MRHRVSGRHLGRTPSHRRAMRRNMAASLIEHEAIRTTEAKAKHLRRFVEKLITLAKKGTLHARRHVIAKLQDRSTFSKDGDELEQTVVQKLFQEIAPRYSDRPGGYTRIIRLSERRIGDAGQQVLLQLVEEVSADDHGEAESTSRRGKIAAKRRAAAEEAAAQQPQPQDQQEEVAEDQPAEAEEQADVEEKVEDQSPQDEPEQEETPAEQDEETKEEEK